MVRRLLFATALVSAQAAVAAQPPCSAETEFEPALCPLSLPPILSIRIEENGAKSPLEKDPAVNCSRFVLSTRQVRRFLVRAGEVPADTGHATLDWSPCHASGTVTFADGRSARWSITQLRVGSLVFAGQAERQLYCPRCKDRPYAR